MSKTERKKKVETPEVSEEIKMEATVDAVAPAETESVIDETPVFTLKRGEVNCGSLNVREKPSLKASVLRIVKLGTPVEIIEEESTKDFYKIILPTGGYGFCMKKFITLK